jgi:CRP/FNR family transcriptional regulator
VGVPPGAWATEAPRRLPHGSIVVRQGDPLECLFLVRSGIVRLSSVTVEGREVVVGILGIGDVFGESALLGARSPVEARAVGSAELVVLPLEHVRDILRHHPGTSAELLRLVASRLHRTSRALEEALVGSVTSRISGRLCDLAEDHGVREIDGVRIPIALTQEELARMVGASREAVNRSLGGLAARGLVRTAGGTIVIRDPEALHATAART